MSQIGILLIHYNKIQVNIIYFLLFCFLLYLLFLKLVPGMRGGHQMCIDCDDGLIYLLGGWNGTAELADFWVYSVALNSWKRLQSNTKDYK